MYKNKKKYEKKERVNHDYKSFDEVPRLNLKLENVRYKEKASKL